MKNISFLLAALLFFTMPAGATEPTGSQDCVSGLPRAGHWPLKDLKSANFYIYFPADLKQALECRGHEEECVPDPNRLKNLSTNYPLALYPENFAKILRPLYKDAIAFALPRDSSGQVPEPTVLSPFSNYACTAATPDALHLILTVTLVDTTNPHIVVLTRTLYRHGNEVYYPPDVPFSTAIPLNLGEEAAETQATRFMNLMMNYFYAARASHPTP